MAIRKNGGMGWTKPELDFARKCAGTGLTVRQTADLMKRSVESIRHTGKRYGFEFTLERAKPQPNAASLLGEVPLMVPDLPWSETLFSDDLPPEVVTPKRPYVSIMDRVPDPLMAIRNANRRPAVADTALPV